MYIARAPGRLDVMGGIADYSGSLVCEMTTKEACHCAVQLQTSRCDGECALPTAQSMTTDTSVGEHGGEPTTSRRRADDEDDGDVELHIVSMPVGEGTGRSTEVKLSLSALATLDTYEKARAYFTESVDGARKESRWARYAAGCFVVLAIEKGLDLRRLIAKSFRVIDNRARQQAAEADACSSGGTNAGDADGSVKASGGKKPTGTKLKEVKNRKTKYRKRLVDRRLRRIAILIRSDVPEGKGVSSSAAIEVSCMQAIAAALDDMSFVESDAVSDARDGNGPSNEGVVSPPRKKEEGSSILGGIRNLFSPSSASSSESSSSTPHTKRAVECSKQPNRAVSLISTPDDLAHLSQIVETQVAGCPCGIMDQMTVVNGRMNHLLLLECRAPEDQSSFKRKARVVGHIPIPHGLRFWGIDSGVRHDNSSTATAGSISDGDAHSRVQPADYTSVRVATFMGRKIIMDRLDEDRRRRMGILKNKFYLCDLEPYTFEARFSGDLPERMAGADFIQKYGTHHDDDAYRLHAPGMEGTEKEEGAPSSYITTVDASRTYAIQQASRHPVYENMRTKLFAKLLEQRAACEKMRASPKGGTAVSASASGGGTEDNAALAASLGSLMLQSHLSYSSVGLGSAATDRLVNLAVERGFGGAKITGGGSGGTVAIVAASSDTDDADIRKLADAYAVAQSGTSTLGGGSSSYVLRGSSPGAADFEVLKVKFTAHALVKKFVEKAKKGTQQQLSLLSCW